MPEGRQSPPPEHQTGAQQQDTPGSGQGIDKSQTKDQARSELENLASNPRDLTGEAAKEKVAKKE